MIARLMKLFGDSEKLREVEARLRADPEFARATVSRKGRNLKDWLPRLSMIERSAAWRFARNLVRNADRLYGSRPQLSLTEAHTEAAQASQWVAQKRPRPTEFSAGGIFAGSQSVAQKILGITENLKMAIGIELVFLHEGTLDEREKDLLRRTITGEIMTQLYPELVDALIKVNPNARVFCGFATSFKKALDAANAITSSNHANLIVEDPHTVKLGYSPTALKEYEFGTMVYVKAGGKWILRSGVMFRKGVGGEIEYCWSS